jgi:hypothetical protein
MTKQKISIDQQLVDQLFEKILIRWNSFHNGNGGENRTILLAYLDTLRSLNLSDKFAEYRFNKEKPAQ